MREAEPYHLHVLNVMKIWEPKPPGTLWATPGLLRESVTFYHLYQLITDVIKIHNVHK